MENKTVLYLAEPGLQVRQDGRRLRLESPTQPPAEYRVDVVERVVVLNTHVGITGPALGCLLENSVPVVFLGPRGNVRGCLAPAPSTSFPTRMAQFAAWADPRRRLAYAKAFIDGKLGNQSALLGRMARTDRGRSLEPDRDRISAGRLAVARCRSIAELHGIEGDAASSYFQGLARILPPEAGFTGRNRRPPRDPVNALLSYGYAILCSEATVAIVGAGLDPECGLSHVPDSGRSALAFDLMEEFRAPVVDRAVVALLNRKEVDLAADFTESPEEGVRLSHRARRTLLTRIEDRLANRSAGATDGYRQQIRLQAGKLAKALREEKAYRPHRMR